MQTDSKGKATSRMIFEGRRNIHNKYRRGAVQKPPASLHPWCGTILMSCPASPEDIYLSFLQGCRLVLSPPARKTVGREALDK